MADVPQSPTAPEAASRTPDSPPPIDDLVDARRSVTTADGELTYRVETGRIVLREEEHDDDTFRGHTPRAEVFVTAYVAGDEPDPARPVVFAFNGGPGSSSVWLHLGLLGPRRVVMGDAGSLTGPPYSLADNSETLLRHADLVFVDPVSTGYSRVVTGGKPKEFHGYKRDLESVGEVIRLWTSRNGRWLSPKFLVGESYGTLRAAALANHLQQRYGMYLNGVGLISTVLDIGLIDFEEGDVDLASTMFLPTYACIAHYHGVSGYDSLDEARAAAEALAADAYPRALAAGHRLDPAERSDLVATLARLTGLREEWLDAADLRIDAHRFFAEVLRGRQRTVGRLDGRFLGWEADGVGERTTTGDPSYSAIHGPYAAALNHYVRDELGYANDLPYEILTDRVHPWSFADFEGKHVSVAGELATAMRTNNDLQVYVACGYYDGATPYFAAEHTAAHLQIPAELRDNVAFRYYEAGHMMYVHEPSRLAQSGDLREFLAAASRPGGSR